VRIGVDAHLVKSKPTGVGKAIVRTIEAMAAASRGAAADEFIVYANREFPGSLDEAANCRVVRTPLIARSRSARILHERFLMPRRLRRDRIDVFHAPGYVFPGEPPAPMVLGIFDVNALKHPNRVRPETAWYYRWAMPRAAAKAALVVAPTHAVAADIERLLEVPSGKIRVVPLAADERFREPPACSAAPCGIDAPYVLFVGNIEPNKNLERLAEAFFAAKLHCGLPHKLVIAGKRRHRADEITKAIGRLGCGEHVVFPGYVDDADLPALYARADAFVYPSRAEGFGIPPLEAMASGTPVITSEDAAVVEVTGDGALHAPADDVAGLREAIETVLTDEARAAALVTRGRAVVARYSWAETGRRTLGVLREAAGGAT